MLEHIRNAAKTWVAKILFFFIAVLFSLWGVESYVQSPSGQDVVAKVADEKVTEQEFNQAVRNQLDQFRQQFGGNIDASIMDTPEMRKSVLDQLIDQRLVASATKSTGVKVSDKALLERIQGEAAFQDNGQFARARYETFLKAQGYTDVAFENLLRQDMQRQQFIDSLVRTSFVGNSPVQQLLRATEQMRDVAVINIAPEQFSAQVKITDEQVKTAYEEKKADYTIPEQVRAEYVELSVDVLAAQQRVAPEELQKVYEDNKARYLQKEERKASHILLTVAKNATEADKKAVKEKADALFAQVKKSPKSFAEVAKKNSQDPGSAVNGGDLGFFGRGAMVAPFEAAAFSAKKDEIVGPVLSDFGYHIIYVTDIKAEKIKTLAEATPEIEGGLKKQMAQRAFADLAEKFSNMAYEQSTSLAAAAEVAKLPIKQSGWITKGRGGVPPFSNQKIVQALFSDEVLKNKRNTEAIEAAPGTLIAARILESKPSTVRPLAEVEQNIRARLTREEASKLAQKEGEAKLAALKEGKSVDLAWPKLLSVNRTNAGGLAPNVIDAAIKANTKTLPAYAGVENPAGGYTLIQIAKVVEPALNDEAKLKNARARLSQSMTQQQIQSLLAQLRNDTRVAITKGALEKKLERQ